jgi:hypothetical protein
MHRVFSTIFMASVVFVGGVGLAAAQQAPAKQRVPFNELRFERSLAERERYLALPTPECTIDGGNGRSSSCSTSGG